MIIIFAECRKCQRNMSKGWRMEEQNQRYYNVGAREEICVLK